MSPAPPQKSLHPSICFGASGLMVNSHGFPYRLLWFSDVVLRGIGQVMLQNNSYTGLLFLLGIFLNSTLLGWATLFGAVVSTATALLWRAQRAQAQDGTFGFNGALVSLALFCFLVPSPLLWAYAALAVACSTVIAAALIRLLKTWNTPALTAPFVLTSVVFILACTHFVHLPISAALPVAHFPHLAQTTGTLTGTGLIEGVFTGIAQVFFQDKPWIGILFALGLLISSRRACACALIGSCVGLGVAWLLGADATSLRSGLFGFNSVLTAIAMGSTFFALSFRSLVYGLLATVVTSILFAALSSAFAPLGLPALTLPFILIVWLFILAHPLLQGEQEPSDVSA